MAVMSSVHMPLHGGLLAREVAQFAGREHDVSLTVTPALTATPSCATSVDAADTTVTIAIST